MKLLSLFILSAATAALAACSGTATSDDTSFDNMSVQKTYRLAGSASDYEAASDLSYRCSAELLVPQTVGGHDAAPLRSAILSAAFDTTATDFKGLVDSQLLANAKELGYALEDTTVADDNYDGCVNVEGNIVTMTPKLISYGVSVYQYYPRAAHGIYGTNYVVYDVESNKKVELSELFTTDGLKKLPEALRATAESMQGYIGSVSLSELPAGDNFYVDANGDIVFAYRPYEIASYAQGEIRIPLQPYLLSDDLTPYGSKLLMNVE